MTRTMLAGFRIALALSALLGAGAAPVRAQGAPVAGGGLVWERVGDQPVQADYLAFDDSGALWANGVGIWRLPPAGSAWTLLFIRSGHALLPLSPDTVLATEPLGVLRSVDGGQTWPLVHDDARRTLYEAPPGVMAAGALFTGTTDGLARSTDRGATWAEATFQTPDDQNWAWSVLALPPGPGFPAGRVVAGNLHGMTLSDDGGQTFRPSALWSVLRYGGYALGAVAGPAGPRALAVVADGTRSQLVLFVSDDGGETWEERFELVDPADGIGHGAVAEPGVLPLGPQAGPSLPRSALVVLMRGSVYRTDDGGETWDWVGRAPVDTSTIRASSAAVGPDGRLYVGLRGTHARAWVWRTVNPVVANEGGPAVEPGLTLVAVPNPAVDTASLVLTLPRAAAAVRVALYDALGREVALVHDGPLGAGTHRLALAASSLAPGVYVARAVLEGGAVTARLVLTR